MGTIKVIVIGEEHWEEYKALKTNEEKEEFARLRDHCEVYYTLEDFKKAFNEQCKINGQTDYIDILY